MIKPKLGRHKSITVLVIVVALVAGWFVYQAVAKYENKRAFSQARAAIDTVYAEIITKVGQPDNYKRSNYCTRSYQEFSGYGDITCSVSTSFIYGLNNQEEADSQMKKTQEVIGAHSALFKLNTPVARTITKTLVVNEYYSTAHDYYKSASDLACETSYIYDTPRETDLTINDTSKKTFQINIDCSGKARTQYYTLSQ